jgi:ketosteroid isomerase-like protein
VSQENVELVRRIWDAQERRKTEDAFALYDPAIVWDATRVTGPLAGVYHGHQGLRQFFREWQEPFEAHHAQAETFIDAGDNNVVVGVRLSGRGKSSGVEVEMPRSYVYRLRNGLVVRVEVFETKAEALEAVGLKE